MQWIKREKKRTHHKAPHFKPHFWSRIPHTICWHETMANYFCTLFMAIYHSSKVNNHEIVLKAMRHDMRTLSCATNTCLAGTKLNLWKKFFCLSLKNRFLHLQKLSRTKSRSKLHSIHHAPLYDFKSIISMLAYINQLRVETYASIIYVSSSLPWRARAHAKDLQKKWPDGEEVPDLCNFTLIHELKVSREHLLRLLTL